MADYLASIFGTEKDKVNCSFYFKIGACRHGEKCSKVHNKPTFSQTVLLKNLYVNPLSTTVYTWDHKVVDPNNAEQVQKHFDDIFEELFLEMESKYGEIEEMNICDNLSEHLAGNTYVKFRYEEDAEKACQALNNRWFGGRPVWAELSPVTDFHEACCRQYQMGECPRGGFCNFMHLKPISNTLRHRLSSLKYAARKYRKIHRAAYGHDDSDEEYGSGGNFFNANGYGNEFTMGGYTRDGILRERTRSRSPRSRSRSPRGRRGGGGGGGGGGGRRY